MTNPRLLHRAKTLRKTMTDAETALWYHLRGHRFAGVKFKRQKPIGPFIVDFVALEHRVVIEVDGGQHVSSAEILEQPGTTRATGGTGAD